MGQNINTTVDHQLAEYYFNRSIDSTLYIHQLDTSIDRVLSGLHSNMLCNHDLTYLTNQVSVDFATLVFAQKTATIPENNHAANLYRNYLEKIRLGTTELRNNKAREYLFVFVPGLFYKRHPETGGDFAAQRLLLNEMGLSTHLIKTNEVGSVSENARIIADELIKLGQIHPNIVVVSASKGGPDLAYAIGKLMSSEDAKALKAWISIGGVLRGSQLADEHLTGLKRLYTKVMTFFIGSNLEFVEDLSRAKSIPRHDSLHFPEDLVIIHYVGAPLSGQLNNKVKKSFKKLSEIGPNDGLTLLADELIPQGIVITELGLDHYYRDPNINEKSIALMYTALQIIDDRAGHFISPIN